MIRMYSQGVGRFSQGVALGYDLVGLSARFLFVRGDDLAGLSARFLRVRGDDSAGLSARFSHVRDDDLGWLSVRCSIDWGDDPGWLSARFLFVRDDDLGWLSVRCLIDWDDDFVDHRFVVPADGDALHVDWRCECGLKAQSAYSPGQRPGCRGWWVIVPP